MPNILQCDVHVILVVMHSSHTPIFFVENPVEKPASCVTSSLAAHMQLYLGSCPGLRASRL